MRRCSVLFVLLLLLAANARGDVASDSTLNEIAKISGDSLRIEALFAYNKRLWETHSAASIPVISQALAEARKIHNPYLTGKAYTALGYSYLLATDYPRSLKYFLEALSIWKKLENTEKEAETLLFLSDIHTKNGDLASATSYANEAIRLCNLRNIAKLKGKAYNQLAIIYEKQHRSAEAIVLYQQGIGAAKAVQDKYFETFLLGNMALSYKSLQQYKKAIASFFEVDALADSLKDPYIKAVANYNISDMYLATGKLHQSEYYAHVSLSAAQSINETETITGCYGLLKELALQRHDYKHAMAYFEKEVAIRDTVFNRDKAAQIAELQTKFDSQIKDRQIRTQQQQISLGRKINFSLVGGILLLGGIGTYIGIQQRRTNRLHRQVSRQKQELEQLNAVKDRIFSVISHDMRTPVNSILAFMELLEQDNMTPQKLAAYSAALKSGMTETASLLDNLLSWARSQMEGYRPVIEVLDAHSILSDAIRLLAPEAKKKQVVLTTDLAGSGSIIADRNLTGIVVRNLLHNAIKYAAPAGTVYIQTTRGATDFTIAIADDGHGFTGDMVDAFNADAIKPMQSTAGTAHEKGSGLGLLLCKTFVRQMNGSISLCSKTGAGSRFEVRLNTG